MYTLYECDVKRAASPTDFAVALGAYKSEYEFDFPTCTYWLRNPSIYSNYGVLAVWPWGSFGGEDDASVESDNVAVRPAMFFDTSVIFK